MLAEEKNHTATERTKKNYIPLEVPPDGTEVWLDPEKPLGILDGHSGHTFTVKMMDDVPPEGTEVWLDPENEPHHCATEGQSDGESMVFELYGQPSTTGSANNRQNEFQDDDGEDSGAGGTSDREFQDDDREDSGAGGTSDREFQDDDRGDSGAGGTSDREFQDDDREDSGAGGTSDRVYFMDSPHVYFRKTEKSDVGKNGQMKKSSRVFKTKHACLYCGKLVSKVVEHMSQKHSDVEEVRSLNRKCISQEDGIERKRKLTELRNKGNHNHNMKVKKEGQGEILLARRPPSRGTHSLSTYKPCPSCFLWVTDIAKHRSYSDRCVMKDSKLSKRQVQLRADLTLGKHKEAMPVVQKEVLSKMSTKDPIATLVMEDPLIIELGNASVRKNIKSLRRGQYASAKMRLCARVLQALRKESKEITWNECLKPEMYQTVVQAVIGVSGGTDETYAHPSNALKAGYHIKELADIKYSKALMKKDNSQATEAETFQILVKKNWAKDVSSLACATMSERNFNKHVLLPLPEDLQKLSTYLQEEAKEITEISDDATYRRAVEIGQARLLTYNKRRPGELEAMKIQQYRDRPNTEEHLGNYLKSLSEFEKRMISTHEVFTVRGKRGRPVPILLPKDIQPIIGMLADEDVRRKYGTDESPYLFANLTNPNSSVFRAGDSLNKAVDAAGLQIPELIRSTNLRKYIATTIQVLSLDNTQMEWVAEHLGHSLDVEKTYYKVASTTIERAKVAKLLLLADIGMVDNYRGKNLDEIQFDDIPVVNVDQGDGDDESEVAGPITQPSASTTAGHEDIDVDQADGYESKTVARPTTQKCASTSAGHRDFKRRKVAADEADPDWLYEGEDSQSEEPDHCEWTEKRRAAYKEVFLPKLATRMLKKNEIEELRKDRPELATFSYFKLKNKINADIQKAKRHAAK